MGFEVTLNHYGYHNGMETRQLYCAGCQTELDSTIDQSSPCRNCGSKQRQRSLGFSATASFRTGLKAVGHHGGRSKKKGLFLEHIDIWEIFHKSGQWVKKLRRIDKSNDTYEEVITDERGEQIHTSSEALSKHRGHGSAKEKP